MKEKIKICIEKLGTVISIFCLIVGIFGCLCECTTDDWFKYLMIFVSMAVLGGTGCFVFRDLHETKKFIEGIWCFFWFSLDNSIKRIKEFMSIVKYYRDNGSTYKEIIKMIVIAKRESKSELRED